VTYSRPTRFPSRLRWICRHGRAGGGTDQVWAHMAGWGVCRIVADRACKREGSTARQQVTGHLIAAGGGGSSSSSSGGGAALDW
jgi:hypothetical protein